MRDGHFGFDPGDSDVSAGEALAGIANFLVLISVIYLARKAWVVGGSILIVRIGGVPIYVSLAVVIGLLLAGLLIEFLRDILLWKSIAALQILIGVVVGYYGFTVAIDWVARCVTLAGAVVTIANGINKFRLLTRSDG